MHTAKELHDEQCFREWLAHWRDHAANAPVVNGYWQRIERALSLLASVEDEDGIVRELREQIALFLVLNGLPESGKTVDSAAALILAQRQEIERVKDLARLMVNQLRHFAPNAESLARYDRAAHPKDAP